LRLTERRVLGQTSAPIMNESADSSLAPQRIIGLIPDAAEATAISRIAFEMEMELALCENPLEFSLPGPDTLDALLIAEEILTTEATENLLGLLSSQEAWSDLPLILLVDSDIPSTPEAAALRRSGHAAILQRPWHPLTLRSCLQVALRARRRQYQVRELLDHRESVLASINDSFILLDRDWRFVYVNQKAAEMYGLPHDRLVGAISWDTVPDLAHPAYRERLLQCASQQQELQIDYFNAASKRWFEKRIYPSRQGLSIFATDITERKKAEEGLRYQLGITQAITDNAADSLFLLDADGCVTFMNPAAEQTFGWNKEELIGKTLHDYVHVHRSRAARLDCPLHSVFTCGLNLRDLEDQFRCKNGSRLFVSCSNAPLRIDGQIAGAVLVVHDITYHKLAEQQLKALNENLELRVAERTAIAEKRATQLSALASELTQTEQRERRRLAHILHDNLQQILVATKLQVGMVRQRVNDEQARSALHHIEDLLTRSVDESRSLTVELSPPILYDAGLGRALDWLARRMHQEHNLAVELVTDPEAEPVGDDIRAFLFQAVRESLFNIVKHAGVGEARVTLARTSGNETVLTIEDSGIGFDPDQGTAKNAAAGGFGLFSIRERLEFLGGRMTIHSAAGQGTSVALWVPKRDRAPQSVTGGAREEEFLGPRTRRGSSTSKPTNVIRVLLADDHKMLRDGLAGLLREQPDIEVISEASDGLMAIELAHQTQPDVIIMDVTMPRMNGVEATRRIHQELPHIRVIGLSMHEKEDMANAMRDAGAVSYITKGAPSEILTEAIRNCMLEARRPTPTLTPVEPASP
jgi:PAS domain S-box-containing protein